MNSQSLKSKTAGLILLIIVAVSLPGKSFSQIQTDSTAASRMTRDTTDYYSGNLDLNLCTAAFDGNSEAVLDLLNKGANPGYEADGLTALHYAILNGHLEVTKILVLNAADINHPTFEGETPLILAVKNGQDEITDFLCQQGVFIDSTDFLKRTPLLYAVANGSFLLTDMLLYYGANPFYKDIDGNDALMVASYTNQPDIAFDLFKYGADLNSRDRYNNTPLIISAEKGYSELSDSLLTWGADPSAKNNAGYTPLAKAIYANDLSTVKSLAKKSVNLNESIRPGIRPLDLAKKYKSIDSLLRKAGAHRSLFPDYNEILIGFDFASNFSDYMNNIHIGLYDPKFKTSVSLGFHTRMTAMKLYVPISETVWYQYRERRYFVWAGIDKQFQLFHPGKRQTLGLLLGIKGGNTFGNYRGSSTPAASEWMFVPSAQIFYARRYITTSIGYEYARYPCFELSPHHLTASIKFHFPLRKEEANYKNIYWIQTNP